MTGKQVQLTLESILSSRRGHPSGHRGMTCSEARVMACLHKNHPCFATQLENLFHKFQRLQGLLDSSSNRECGFLDSMIVKLACPSETPVLLFRVQQGLLAPGEKRSGGRRSKQAGFGAPSCGFLHTFWGQGFATAFWPWCLPRASSLQSQTVKTLVDPPTYEHPNPPQRSLYPS